MLAAIPILFAFQQWIEGSQWIAQHPSSMSLLLGYAYLFFAFLLWPIYIPITAYFLEASTRVKKLFRWWIGIGAVVTLAMLGVLATQRLSVELLPAGIFYNINVPLGLGGMLLYIGATCGSLLCSSHRTVRWIGFIGILTAAFSAFVFNQTFTSVWCFFAAILSGWIFFIIKQQRTENLKKIPRRSKKA